jgi:hypothetical protein
MRPAPRFTVVAILLSCLAASGAHAQWSPDGVVVCDATKAQVEVEMVSDGSGGTILAWQDGRNTVFPDYDIYAQHLLASGVLDPAWPAQGLAVCAATNKQLMPLLAPDGAGGAFVVWADYRSTTSGALVYAQHLTAAGAIAPGWPADGLSVSSLPVYNWLHFDVSSDGQGGAIIGWLGSPLDHSFFPVAMQRLTGAGIAPGWPGDGIRVWQQLMYGTGFVRVAGDGAGGGFVAWSGSTSGGSGPGLYLQHVGSDSAPAPGWPANGTMVIGPNSGVYDTHPVLPDGLGGAFVATGGTAGEGESIWDQRAGTTGTPLWGSAGVPLGGAPIADDLHFARDGAGGVFVAWEVGVYNASNASTWDVRVLRQDATGAPAPGWTGPTFAADTAGSQMEPRIVEDGTGGAFLVWRDWPIAAGHGHIQAQHLDGAGNPMPGWSSAGMAVCPTDSSQILSALIADGTGGMIVAFTDYRNRAVSGPDLRAQHLLGNGSVAAVGPRTIPDIGFVAGPNPCSGPLRVTFALPCAKGATLELIDISGRCVASRALGTLEAGPHDVRWDAATSLESGVYWVRLRGDHLSVARRIALLR